MHTFTAGVFLFSLSGVSYAATSFPQNLGNGLDKLVQTKVPAFYNSVATSQGNALANLAIVDDQGRVLVRINSTGKSSTGARMKASDLGNVLAANIGSLKVTAVDNNYRGVGVMNAWVALSDVVVLAGSSGVRSVILELKPRHGPPMISADDGSADSATSDGQTSAVSGTVLTKLGTAFDQGVTQHRIDQINQFYNPNAAFDYEGQGMSIGFLSDSYANITTASKSAPNDVSKNDLPGSATNPVNTQPVVVLQDYISGGTDEGRAMVQIGYKMAPKARLAFATADFGEVGFANNIRALAGMPGYTYDDSIQQGFAADTICDDVGYYDEPFFQDGIIGQGVNDVAAYGVAYFSSAANDIGINGYESELRWVPNDSNALAGTNINLANVPPVLYAGGFHNFNPVPGQLDVAQTVNIASSANQPPTDLQWDDPYDQNTSPDYVEPPVWTQAGELTSSAKTQTWTIDQPLQAGLLYELDATANAGSSVDSIVTLIAPDGTVIVNQQDTTIDEVVRFYAPVSGSGYKVIEASYNNQLGTYTLTLHATDGFSGNTISTDVNLLVFDMSGNYLPGSSLTTNNFATNEPIELDYTLTANGRAGQVQFVITRANVPATGGATHVRYLMAGNGASGIGPAEYFTYNTVTTGGHAMANGSNGMAAYSVFRPNLPETFTSPGPVTIYFDGNGSRLALPEVRRQPTLAAADAGNTSFFTSDTTSDLDTNSNFSGTSAAGPHAAAIGALVLQAHGGSHSLSPAQMTNLLERSTFPHDLDPSYASGFARTNNGDKVTITINSDGDSNTGTGLNDANSISVAYTGSGSLTNLTFNPQGTAATAGNVSGGNNGIADANPATSPQTVTYFENNYPGMVFMPSSKAFTVGSNSTVTGATATYSNLAPAPSNGTNQYWTMNLAFQGGSFTDGNVLRYTVGRGVQHSATTGNGTTIGAGSTSASYLGDLLGGGVSIPSGTVALDGMTFSGTTADGGTFSGVIRNRVGTGYSPVDGYGFINAQTAVGQSVQ